MLRCKVVGVIVNMIKGAKCVSIIHLLTFSPLRLTHCFELIFMYCIAFAFAFRQKALNS